MLGFFSEQLKNIHLCHVLITAVEKNVFPQLESHYCPYGKWHFQNLQERTATDVTAYNRRSKNPKPLEDPQHNPLEL